MTEGDQIKVGNISNATGVAIGAGARATVYQGLSVEEVAALVVELKDKDQPLVWDGRLPYLGLNAFQESDAQFFFGREELVDDLLRRVRENRFIVIAGPSGSGKSSLARAGLFHALRQGRLERSEKWVLATMSPKDKPVENLALAIGRDGGDRAAAQAIGEDGGNNPLLLHEQVELLGAMSDDRQRRFVLLVDQFEELFTQTADQEAREKFIRLLTRAAAEEGSRTTIILSLRSDFVSNCALYPDLRAQINRKNQFQLVGAMEARDLAKAITLPALQVGAVIEPALVKQIIDDMKGEPGALPLMSFALRDLFLAEKTAKGAPMDLTRQEYVERGGIDRALERHANHVFASFSAEQRELAKGIFSKLITVGEGRVDTRRTAVFEELVPADAGTADVAAVVGKLASEGVRLVTTSGVDSGEDLAENLATAQSTVTIAHEKLIDAWPWLRQLVNENRNIIRMQSKIAEDARNWEEKGHESSYLYTGARLATVEEQLAEAPLQLSTSSKVFLEVSIAKRKAARRRTEMAIGGLVTITLVAVLAATLAMRATRQATARRMATDARRAAEMGQLRLATLLAIEATNRDSIDAGQMWQDVLVQNTPYREIGALSGHQNDVWSVDWHPNGKRLASASADGTVRIWDAVSGDELAVLIGHQSEVPSVAWQPVDDRIASASYDGTVRIWDATSGAELAVLAGHEGPVWSVDWHPDGSRLASASLDRTVRIWDAASGKELAVLAGHQTELVGVDWHPNGERLASACADGTVRIWDAASGTELAILEGHQESVMSVAWHPDGKRLASTSKDGTVRIWDVTAEAELAVLVGHLGEVWSVDWHPDGERVASASSYGGTRIWDTASGDELAVLAGDQDVVWSVDWHPDGSRLATALEDGTVRIWDATSRAELTVLAGHQVEVQSVAWHPDGNRLASASADRTVRIWDATSGAELAVLAGHDDWVQSVAWDPDGERLASGSMDNTVRIWNAASGAELAVLAGHQNNVTSVAWDPDGERLASASWDHTVRIWDATSGAELAVLASHQDYVWNVTWDPLGERLASASADGTVRIWNATSGVVDAVLAFHRHPAQSVAWEPDGKRLATAFGRTVHIWDTASGDELAVLSGHQDLVWSIAWDLDGERLASASGDGTVRIWDATSEAELAVLAGHQDVVWSVAWDPEDERIASASHDGTVQIRSVSTGCDRIMSNFAIAEWRSYVGTMLPYKATCSDLSSPPPESVPFISDPFLTNGRWAGVISMLLCPISALIVFAVAAYFLIRTLFRRIRAI